MYIVSLTHTRKHEKYVTLWRPDNKGYCYSKQMAGSYENPQAGYHDSQDNMPISEEKANELFESCMYDGEYRMMIPNNKKTWTKLGVKMTRDGLVRLK